MLEHAFRELTLKPGSMASLKCSASGNPLPQITWTLDSQAVPEVYHIRIGELDRSVARYGRLETKAQLCGRTPSELRRVDS